SYLMDCEQRFGRGRSFLYDCKSVAQRLLPAVPETTLIDMGITKARELAQYTKKKGKNPDENLISKAMDGQVSTDEFRAMVAESLHEKPEKGKWYEFGGFYATPEEKKEIDRLMLSAREQVNLPENCSEMLERKIIFQAMVAECLSSW